MLDIRPVLPVKFICAFIYSDESLYKKTKTLMERKFGKIDFESQKIDFNHTDYYMSEMGKNLFRRFISFKKLINPKRIVDIKLFCIKLEKKLAVKDRRRTESLRSHERRRRINIDPGYLTEAKLVLSTTKDFAHRIYLNKGIYAEVTLTYSSRGEFCDFPTTFSDYKTPRYKEIFLKIREILYKQLKQG